MKFPSSSINVIKIITEDNKLEHLYIGSHIFQILDDLTHRHVRRGSQCKIQQMFMKSSTLYSEDKL